MNKLVIVITAMVLCSSCATIMNSPTKRVDIITTTPAQVVIKKDTLSNIRNRTKIQVERNLQPLTIIVFNDSISREIVIESRSSFAYWFNIYANCGIGILIDNDSPKRYTYPNHVYIDLTNNAENYYRLNPLSRKGHLYLHISLPHINNFVLKPQGENSVKVNTGFWGLLAGIDYYHRENQFFNISVSGVSDFFCPVPAAVDISGEYEMMSSLYASISNNHRIKRFSLGYGLSFSKNTWDLRYYDTFDPHSPTRDPVKKSSNAIGFISPLYFQAGDHFYMGFIYRPTFLQVYPVKEFNYEHLISIDFVWKFNLTK